MNQKCITRPTAQTMHFMLHNTDWVYSSISTDDCRGFWNSCTLYLPVQHTTQTYILSAARFYVFASFIKAPLTRTALFIVYRAGKITGLCLSKPCCRFPAPCYSLLRRVVGLPPGRRQLSEMGEEVKIKYLEFKIDLRIL